MQNEAFFPVIENEFRHNVVKEKEKTNSGYKDNGCVSHGISYLITYIFRSDGYKI